MKRDRKIKVIVDIVITLMLILQMGYMLTGDLSHEITGTITIVLWIVHSVLHRKWFTAIAKSRYPLKRVIDTVINILLTCSVIGILTSSIILSSYVYKFLGIQSGMAFARITHMVSVYWCFVLSSLHLGMHWTHMIKIMQKEVQVTIPRTGSVILQIIVLLLSAFGVYAFIKNQVGLYMFRRVMFVFFDFSQSPISFFFEYISIMILFASISSYFSELLKKRSAKKKSLSLSN